MSKLLARSREVAVRPLEQTPHAIDYGRNRLHGYLVQPPRICSHDTASAPMRQRHSGATSVFSDKDSRPTISSPATDDKYLDEVYNSIVRMSCSEVTESEIVEVDGPNDLEHQLIKDQEPCLMKTEFDEPRKYSESSYHAADEDGTNKKYTRRETGKKISIHMLIGRMVLASRACMATMGILHYQLAQDSLDESRQEDELQ
ncbi:hypothetical protein ZIOFF_014807 [Zingiber officinale]|uniref:Uncharacterized protein n=1 Tax=Zingiber officinale TaxID=94328 RepID=A0A8J5LEL7_ZINOF|nr:hypothetical protein ZIOFF_014807 [Zingiber officinale]